jgi:predicted KAP-like P-loop ATPase
MRYIDLAMLFLCVIEVVLLCYRIGINCKGEDNTQLQTIKNCFMADLPSTEDGFNRKYYADSLWSLILSTFTKKHVVNAAFTILLNEKYGSGKSSFFNILRKSINDQSYIIDFKPWICSDETQMIDELIEQLITANVIEEHKMLINYANTLANHDSWVGVIGKIFTSTYSVSLNDQYEAIKKKMELISKPIVVFVDDVDRLADRELMGLLKLIRNTADFPNMFYIIAADKQYLCSTILRSGVNEASNYLQKFFNFEMTFPKDDKRNDKLLKETMQMVLSSYDCEKKESYINDFCNLKYIQFMIQTPRDIYRYCNMLTFELELFRNNDLIQNTNILNEIYYPDLMVLTLLHYMSDDIYKLLRDRDEYILTMKSYGQLYLHENYQDIIGKMYGIEEVVESVLNEKIQKKRNVCKTIDEATTKTLPEYDILIASLLENLFPNSNNVSQYSIAMAGEYYKYFAGRCAKTEMTGAEVHNVISLVHDEFDRKIREIIKHEKYEHFKIKLSNYF